MNAEVTSRMGWIAAPRESRAAWGDLVAFAARARADGLDRALVCGMGGSSLAPRVLAESAGATALGVLDSPDPVALRDAVRPEHLGRMLFVITSKSGTTVETLAFYRHFATRARPGQFVAITDPGSALETLARQRGFRAVFPHPPDVGGRYAALTVVGMLPAALLGLDGATLLDRALALEPAPARAFGTGLAEAALAGRDKLVLRPPAPVARLADWIEQLVAESSGKQGRGVVPVVGARAQPARPDAQVVTEFSPDPLDLGAEFLRWEYATWALCERRIAEHLAARVAAGLHTYSRLSPPLRIVGNLDLSDMTLDDLVEAARSIFARVDLRQDLKTVVAAPRVTIRQQIAQIVISLRQNGRSTFQAIVRTAVSRLEIVVTFLALLELIKRNRISAQQETLFGDIELVPDPVLFDSVGVEDFELEFGE